MRPLFDEITGTLDSVIAIYSRVFIVVDALDECQASDGCRSRFLSEVFNLQVKSGASIFATSRFLRDITDRFKHNTNLEICASVDDVRSYLECHMSQLPSFVSRNINLQEEIVTEITQNIDGMHVSSKSFRTG